MTNRVLAEPILQNPCDVGDGSCNHWQPDSLVLLEYLLGFECVLCARLVRAKHDNRCSRTSRRRSNQIRRAEATCVSRCKTTSVASIKTGVGSAYGTGHD